MSRMSNDDSSISRDSAIEAELRSYFATSADQPPAIEELWQRLSLQLELTGAERSQNTIAVAAPDALYSPMPVTPGRRQPSSFRRRLSALGALAAVLAVVVVFALVVHSFRGGRHAPSNIMEKLPTLPREPNAWNQVAQFPTHNNYLNSVVVGLNDPNVIYEVNASTNHTFQRSDDGGKTWHTGSFPAIQVGNASILGSKLYINPLDAHMVWVSLMVGPEDPNCHPAAPGAGCTYQYVSTDGGATWAPIQMPGGLVLGYGALGTLDGGAADGFIYVQGHRLYTQLSSGNPDPTQSHLATTLDGIHWSFADSQLTAKNLVVMEFAVTPTGSTIFATTIPQNGSLSSSKRELWRSDDAGAHWTNLGGFPSGHPHLLGAAEINDMTLVYYVSLDAEGEGILPDHVFASANNGLSWQAAPTIALPPGDQVYNAVYYGTLANGAVLTMFGAGTGHDVYSWQPGDKSWTKLSQTVTIPSAGYGPYLVPWYTPAHDGVPAELWNLTTDSQSNFVLWSCALS